MSNIVSFDGGAKLPSYLAKLRDNPVNINADVVGTGPSYPVLSIKGKVFTLVRGDERKVMTVNVEGDEMPRSSLTLSVARANTKARTYYAKQWVEGEESQGAPDCQSSDGVTPDSRSTNPQATKCAVCPHAVWGSRPGDSGKGTACRQMTRLAVCDPDHPEMKFLLRVPPASRKSFAEAVKQGQQRNIPYNALIYKVSFDAEASSPTLVFKPTGLASDALYAHLTESYEAEEVKEMVGLGVPVPAVAPRTENVELDAAIAAKAATTKAAAPAVTQAELDGALQASAPAPAPKPRSAPKPAPAPAPTASANSDLLKELDALLGHTDD